MEYGFKKTAQLLAEEKIFAPRFLSYATQLIPLSCICATLSNQIDNASIKEKVLRWYWCGVFGELYGGANETRFSQDLPNVVDWVNGGEDVYKRQSHIRTRDDPERPDAPTRM